MSFFQHWRTHVTIEYIWPLQMSWAFHSGNRYSNLFNLLVSSCLFLVDILYTMGVCLLSTATGLSPRNNLPGGMGEQGLILQGQTTKPIWFQFTFKYYILSIQKLKHSALTYSSIFCWPKNFAVLQRWF